VGRAAVKVENRQFGGAGIPCAAMSTPPPFIVFDGSEGAGKSTQVALLKARFESLGRPVLLVRDPGTTRIGERIRAILLDPENAEMSMRCEMMLYMAARAQMMSETILPALRDGKTVISDRFVSSTLAYQLGGEGLTAADIRAAANTAIQGRWPDLTILLDMPVEASMARLKRSKDRIEQRPLAYFEQVRRNYLAQADADPASHRVVNADRPVEDVAKEVWSAVEVVLP
jgi:dTMP kinase